MKPQRKPRHNLRVDVLRNVRLHTRLFTGFLIITVFALGLASLVSYHLIRNEFRREISDHSVQTLEHIRALIVLKLDRYKAVLNQIATDTRTIRALSKEGDYRPIDRALTARDLTRSLEPAMRTAHDGSVFEITSLKETFVWYPLRMTSSPVELSEYWVRSMRSDDRFAVFTTSGLEYEAPGSAAHRQITYIVITVPIYGVTDSQLLGFAMGGMPVSVLREFLNLDPNRATAYYLHENGVTIPLSATSNNTIEQTRLSRIAEKLRSDYAGISSAVEDKGESTILQSTFANADETLFALPVSGTDWKIVAVANTSDLMQRFSFFTYTSIGIVFMTSLIVVPFARILANTVTVPLGVIRKSMQTFEGGQLDTRVDDDCVDEIGDISRSFNRMADRTQRYIARTYGSRLKTVQAEIEALQGQMNPHFLYNTLDSINWMAYAAGNTAISEMVTSLSKFYRYGAANGKPTHSIAEEVEHLETYINIQRVRYGHRIDFVVKYEPDVLDFHTVRFTLQPLVENAIYHGLDGVNGKGEIRTHIWQDDGFIFMEVSDTGNGIRDVLAADGLPGPSEDYSTIRNIDERIKLFYGYDYGLRFGTRTSGGTRVLVRFPAGGLKEGSTACTFS